MKRISISNVVAGVLLLYTGHTLGQRNCEVVIIYEEPVIEAEVDTLAEALLNERWHCDGEGCAEAEDVARIADLLRDYGGRHDISLDLAFGVMMVENPWLDSVAVSSAGAIGLMQVMPFHAGEWGCGSNLYDTEVNICTGMAILNSYIERRRTLRGALLGYNGCTGGAHCADYPDKVQAWMVD